MHIAIGILGNTPFVVGSVLFFKRFEQWYEQAVWLFVIDSTYMLVGALGEALKAVYERRENRSKQSGQRTLGRGASDRKDYLDDAVLAARRQGPSGPKV